MTAPLIIEPNAEALLSQFLRDQDEIDNLVDGRVYTAIPKSATYPLVRVSLFDDAPTLSRPLWHVAYFLQLEAFGGSKSTAWQIASTCRAAIVGRLEGVYDAFGVVTGAEVSGLRDVPDDSDSPARPRWIFTVTMFAHPVP